MKVITKFIFISFIGAILFIGCESTISNADSPGPTGRIQFSLPVDSYVKLTLENSYNTIVETLIDDQLVAGTHQVEIDSYKLSEGVYFYTLIAKGIYDESYYETTKKMILIKR
jgi:hypothetical protein